MQPSGFQPVGVSLVARAFGANRRKKQGKMLVTSVQSRRRILPGYQKAATPAGLPGPPTLASPFNRQRFCLLSSATGGPGSLFMDKTSCRTYSRTLLGPLAGCAPRFILIWRGETEMVPSFVFLCTIG